MDDAAEYPYRNIIASSDEEIEKHNRLFLLKKVHKDWLEKQRKPDVDGNVGADPYARPQHKEKIMATAKTYKGACELCKANDKTLRKYVDMMVCASCQPVLIAARKRPQSLVAALDRFDNLPDSAFLRPANLSDEARRTAADNGRNGGVSPEILGRLDRIEKLADKILRLEGVVLKVDLVSGGEAA